jgi:hypothetical protein
MIFELRGKKRSKIMAKVRKTKIGSEYRVRGTSGKLFGEFNKKSKALNRAVKKGIKKGGK